MFCAKKRVGIWGCGIVGKSAVPFFSALFCEIEVMDKRTLDDAERCLFNNYNIRFYEQNNIFAFLDRNDYIFVSPGIDISEYFEHYRTKWIFEVDLFYALFKKPIIAITGSVGKTTVTSFIASILEMYGKKVVLGGNIGNALCNLITHQNIDYAVIELSSFQLEYCKSFAPDFAIWTNLIENHLDRHITMQNYFFAKYNIIANQNEGQLAILPLSLASQIKHLCGNRSFIFFNDKNAILQSPDDILFYFDNSTIRMKHNKTDILILQNIPDISYKINWLTICALLYTLHLDLTKLNYYAQNLALADHRIQKVAVVQDVIFYNDSKATTPASTLAALEHLASNHIHLFLGGLSKGVDRLPFVASLKKFNITLYCFGAEADALHAHATQHAISSFAFSSLKEAFDVCTNNIKPSDIVLFSPSGSSYDLFKNYAERGEYFIKLVTKYSNLIAHSATKQ